MYFALTLSRGIISLFDLLGLAALGFLGAAVASELQGQPSGNFLGFTLRIGTNNVYFQLVFFVAVFFLSKSAASIFLLWMTTRFLSRVETRAAMKLADYLFSGDLKRLKQFSKGDLHFSIAESTKHAMFHLLIYGSSVFAELSLFLAISIVFVYIDAATATLVAAYFLLLIGGLQVGINRKLRRTGETLRGKAIGILNAIEDLVVAYREITVLSKNHYFLGRLGKLRREEAETASREMFLYGLPRSLVETGLMLGVLGLIAWQFWWDSGISGIASTAIFLAGGARMMAALLPLQNSLSRMKTMAPRASLAQDLLQEARACESPQEIMDPGKDLIEKSRNGDSNGLAVTLRDVYFSYGFDFEPVIRGVSLEVKPGEQIALVGPSGSGKTTLADLILGMHQPHSGSILIDGSSPTYMRTSFPGKVSYVPQSPGLVTGSIAQNIALGIPRAKIDEEKLMRVLDLTKLSDFIENLAEGIHSELGKQLDSMSGGQKQRLGLARALYSSPSLLILDEATSALDAETEASISDVINQLTSTTTVIVIAHRLSTIQHADTVFVIEEGTVSARGTFSEVRKQVPLIEKYIELMSFPEKPD